MMMDRRRIILCASLITLFIMTNKALIGPHEAAPLDAQTTKKVVSQQHKTLFFNSRKLAALGTRRRGGGVIGTRGSGKKSSAIRVRISMSQATFILCTSLLMGFFLLL
ncbi:hypothetical protein PIB30_024406 [Stylosanthes scabra]|uniref:Transmembrane protein n=1 Tax=Stylosanthes scabra TaxID=79078 RepID=A0ABU6T9Z6_9FABA|nr:hypothetical protein [Stylosanthes scabra]